MIGFDRPLKPVWIYKTLQVLKVDASPSTYYLPFENIANELVGKEGKRKVRTIIFRSFIYSFQARSDRIEGNLFIDWVHQSTLEQLQPLLLAKILMDHEVCRFITQKIRLSFDHSNLLSSSLLTKRMVQEYGDRDVVKRSVRSFLKTLVFFNCLEQIDKNQFRLLNRYSLNQEQIRKFILLYSKSYLKSGVVDLSEIENTILYYFTDINFSNVAREYHSKDWEYIRDLSRNVLLVR